MERWHEFALMELATVSFWCKASWRGIHRSRRIHEMERVGFGGLQATIPVVSLKI